MDLFFVFARIISFLISSSVQQDDPGAVGERLYLTPYIEAGEIKTARNMSEVTEPLEGLQPGEQPLSYSGYITVKSETNSHMFFWFVPATEVDPTTAPITLWLQGGPGSSSLFALFEINGPFSCIYKPDDNLTDGAEPDTQIELNPYAWTREVNMIYLDQPVGSGFSHTDVEGFVKNQTQIGSDVYEFLLQWFKLFPDYQKNKFFVFGESYAGKFVPAVASRIHIENFQTLGTGNSWINFAGIGIGNGIIDPYTADVFGDFLYQLGLIDEQRLEILLEQEDLLKTFIDQENWDEARLVWNGIITDHIGCPYYMDVRQCDSIPEENNFKAFARKNSTRRAVHAGDMEFDIQADDCYRALYQDLMKSELERFQMILEMYPVLVYSGNMDIICNYSGTMKTLNSMKTWSHIEEYLTGNRTIYYSNKTESPENVHGYLKSAGNLKFLMIRNSGHMVPRDLPDVACDFFNKFVKGEL